MPRGKNGEGYCPCGDVKRATCNACGRKLCGWHHALGPFADGEGGIGLAPVCWPACSAEWWEHAGCEYTAQERLETARPSPETIAHAAALLRRGADPGAVARELGISECTLWARIENPRRNSR